LQENSSEWKLGVDFVCWEGGPGGLTTEV